MVMVIGFYTYENMSTTQYDMKIKASLTKFANDLETVYAGGKGGSMISALDFSPMGAGGDISHIEFTSGTAQFCLKEVATPDCYVISAVGTHVVGDNLMQEIRFAHVLKIPTSIAIWHSRQTKLGAFVCSTIHSADVDVDGHTYDSTQNIGDINQIFEEVASGFSDDTCFSWGARLYSLKIKKIRNDVLLIEG